jgi:Rho termination factor, N-terminal domain
MKTNDIRTKAKDLGVKNCSRMKKDELIKAIQCAEGNSPCYREIPDCRIMDCLWREECQPMPKSM